MPPSCSGRPAKNSLVRQALKQVESRMKGTSRKMMMMMMMMIMITMMLRVVMLIMRGRTAQQIHGLVCRHSLHPASSYVSPWSGFEEPA